MIDKTYQPSAVEGRIYAMWEEAGAFRGGRPERRNARPYCIVIPPPNVTGSLHMGHALNNTLQDVLARFERMRGRDVLWQPGTDHAGIATQMVVERQLMERQEPGRRALGREKFLEKVWAWKAESGGTIIQQLKRLGASCDWSRERFTLDEGLSRAVRKVFVELYRQGLIYKDKRLVNWDPELLTAISDLEVQQVEVKGSLWHIRYPLEGVNFDPNDPSTFITVATTRPETMLGDVAIAVHPENERLKHLIGKHAILPLVGRRVPIIGDDYADPEKGTGAVKITPAHDFNDFEVGKRHGLPQITVIGDDARMVLADNAEFLRGFVDDQYGHRIANMRSGDRALMRNYAASLLEERNLPELAETIKNIDGLDRFEARKLIVELIKARGLVDTIEPHVHMVPHGDRSGVVIEPALKDQWYVDAKTLAKPAIEAVRDGRTAFVPKNWEKTYFEWMENIQPWCISRQLWWGHQIPAWYGPDKSIFVEMSDAEVKAAAEKHYGCSVRIGYPESMSLNDRIASIITQRLKIDEGSIEEVTIERDEDVLDTWFSSALWPFSTLGWPDETQELKRYYPTNALVTSFDIIFFWVARMMMMGLHFMNEVPFRTVYIHALVRDERGAKMSKSKGNVVDPIPLIDEYGADALRFTLAAMAAQGRDIKLSMQRVEGSRNFTTKLWNACRFAEINNCVRAADYGPKSVKETLNRWVLGEAGKAVREVTAALEVYKFNEAAAAIYHFTWNVYCDWYLELCKPLLTGPDGEAKNETLNTVAFVLDQILKLLHPFMPFLTEELWRVTGQEGPERETMLALAPWPRFKGPASKSAEKEVGRRLDLISALRSMRSELNVPPAAQIPLTIITSGKEREWVKLGRESIERLARVSEIRSQRSAPKGAVQLIVRRQVVAVLLAGVIDFAAERARLENELVKIADEIAGIDQKLGNKNFIERAPEEVVEEQRERREEAESRRAKVEQAIERLKAAVAEPSLATPRASRSKTQPTVAPKRAKNASKAKRKKNHSASFEKK